MIMAPQTEVINEPVPNVRSARRPQWTLSKVLWAILVFGLVLSNYWTAIRLQKAEGELRKLYAEVGHLDIQDHTKVAASRIPDDTPLLWQFRVYVPQNEKCRVAYSTRWFADASRPDWYSFIAVPAGESVVTTRIGSDERDGAWKISTSVRQNTNVSRSTTVLPDDQVTIFKQHRHAISSGQVGAETVQTNRQETLKLLEDKWILGESAIPLFGERPPVNDIVGVFLELQPD